MPPDRISPGSNGEMAEIHTRVEQQRRVVEELRHRQRPNRREKDSRRNDIGTTNDPETNSRVPTYSTAGNLVASGSTAGAVIRHAVPSTGRRTRSTSRLGNNGVSNEAHSSIPRAAPSTDIVHLKRNSGDLVQSMTNASSWGIPFSFGMGAAPFPTSARAPSNVTNVTVNLGQQTPPTASSVNAPTSSGSSSTNAGTSSSWDWPDRALWNVTQTIQSRELSLFFHELWGMIFSVFWNMLYMVLTVFQRPIIWIAIAGSPMLFTFCKIPMAREYTTLCNANTRNPICQLPFASQTLVFCDPPTTGTLKSTHIPDQKTFGKFEDHTCNWTHIIDSELTITLPLALGQARIQIGRFDASVTNSDFSAWETLYQYLQAFLKNSALIQDRLITFEVARSMVFDSLLLELEYHERRLKAMDDHLSSIFWRFIDPTGRFFFGKYWMNPELGEDMIDSIIMLLIETSDMLHTDLLGSAVPILRYLKDNHNLLHKIEKLLEIEDQAIEREGKKWTNLWKIGPFNWFGNMRKEIATYTLFRDEAVRVVERAVKSYGEIVEEITNPRMLFQALRDRPRKTGLDREFLLKHIHRIREITTKLRNVKREEDRKREEIQNQIWMNAGYPKMKVEG